MKISRGVYKNIAVFRALQLGDMLCAVPALRALRHAYPHATITLLGLPWESTFVSRFSGYLDSFLHFPGYSGLPEQPFDPDAFEAFETVFRKRNFDLVLQMQGNGTIVNEMLATMTHGQLAGFHSEGNRMDPAFFIDYPEGISEIRKHLMLLRHLGIADQGTHLEFPVTDAEKQALAALNLPVEPGKYVCVHPGSRGSWRQWPPAHFAALADVCAGLGYQILITGTREERDISASVLELMQYPALDLTGRTGLGEIGELIRHAFMLISNCTGVSHIASATRTPSIVISMDCEPERWGPLNTQIHKTIDWTRDPGYTYVLNEMNALIGSLTAK